MKTSMTRFALALSLLMGVPTSFAAESGLIVEDPWVREAPPVAKVLAAYLVVDNKSGQVRVLKGASSPAFERVEIHKTEVRDGVANMLRQDQVQIPAQGSLVFKSGGYHLMLIGPKKSLRAGDQIALSLSFANGEEIALQAEVRKAMEEMSDMADMPGMSGMSGMNHSGMDQNMGEMAPMQNKGSMDQMGNMPGMKSN